MQKTEKHCKNQCFLLSQNDENQSGNGSKNSKIRLRARPPAEPQKKMLQTKNWGQKVEKHGFFFTFRLPILDGRVHEQVSSVLFFYSVFWRRASTTYQKQEVFGRKMGPPPGKTCNLFRVPSGRSRPSTFGAGGFYYICIYIYICILEKYIYTISKIISNVQPEIWT